MDTNFTKTGIYTWIPINKPVSIIKNKFMVSRAFSMALTVIVIFGCSETQNRVSKTDILTDSLAVKAFFLTDKQVRVRTGKVIFKFGREDVYFPAIYYTRDTAYSMPDTAEININPTTGLYRWYCPLGTRYQAILPNGAAIWLNAGSTIELPHKLSKSDTIMLTGEACFQVSTPLTVQHVNGLATIVNGKANLKCYEEDIMQSITVNNGRTKVWGGKTRETLTLTENLSAEWRPGFLGIVSYYSGEDAISWTKGFVGFGNMTEDKDIVNAFYRWFKFKILYQDKYPLQFEGKIPEGESVRNILNIIEAVGYSYETAIVSGELNVKISAKKID